MPKRFSFKKLSIKELTNLLAEADKAGIDQITFLMQHSYKWQYDNQEVYKFLYKNNHLKKPDVMNFFRRKYFSDNISSRVVQLITRILGDILSRSTDAELCAMAMKLLVRKSRPCDERYTLDYLYRLEAFEQLKHCTGDVQDLIQNIIENDSKFEMKIAALNRQENRNRWVAQYNTEIIQNILTGLIEKEWLTQDDLYKIEYIMWHQPAESKTVWQMLEVAQTDRLLQLFTEAVGKSGLYASMRGGNGYRPLSLFSSSISWSAPLYSILKFIACHTTNEETYTKIINQVLPLVREQEDGDGIGMLTGSDAFLDEATQNPNFNPAIPAWDNANCESAFEPRPDFAKEWGYFHDTRKSALLKIFSDEKQDLNGRIVAMRMFAKYRHDSNVVNSLLEQIQGSEERLRQEAQRLLGWVAPHALENISEYKGRVGMRC